MRFRITTIVFVLFGMVTSSPRPGVIDDVTGVIDSVIPFPSSVLTDTIKDLLSINILKDIPMAIRTLAPVKHKVATKIPHGTPEEVKENLQAALIGMCPATKVLSIECVCDTKFPDATVVKNKDNNAYALVAAEPSKNRIVVSYRFTVSYQNWLTDFDYTQVQLKGAPKDVNVHRGFQNYYRSISNHTQDLVLKLLNDKKYINYTLHITGYSLGAAIATISTPDWVNLLKSHNMNNKIKVFTYSGPRPGNAAFANYIANLNIPVNRYTYLNDIVPHTPIRTTGYVHAGVEFHDQFDPKTNKYSLKVCSQEFDEDPNCSSGAAKPYSPINHMLPFGSFILVPPFC